MREGGKEEKKRGGRQTGKTAKRKVPGVLVRRSFEGYLLSCYEVGEEGRRGGGEEGKGRYCGARCKL